MFYIALHLHLPVPISSEGGHIQPGLARAVPAKHLVDVDVDDVDAVSITIDRNSPGRVKVTVCARRGIDERTAHLGQVEITVHWTWLSSRCCCGGC